MAEGKAHVAFEEEIMFGLLAEAASFYRGIVGSFRMPRVLRLLVGAAFLILGSAMILRGANTLRGTNDLNPPHQQGGKLSVEELGQDLTEAYGNNTVNSSGRGIYSVDVKMGKYVINVCVNMSPNGNVIWMITSMAPMPAPGRTSATALLNLLNKNSELAPKLFMIQGGRVALASPVPNHDLNAATVKAYVDDLSSTVVETLPLWNPRTLRGE
jgi:hypothetical protein